MAGRENQNASAIRPLKFFAAGLVLLLLIVPGSLWLEKRGAGARLEAPLAPAELSSAGAATADPPALLISPEHPRPGEVFRVLAAASAEIGGAHIRGQRTFGRPGSASDKSGRRTAILAERRIPRRAGGRICGIAARSSPGRVQATLQVSARPASRKPASGIWENIRKWDRETELLFSAWINALFQTPTSALPGPRSTKSRGTRQPTLLHNHLGLGEDDPAGKPTVIMEPDCADNPFYLRAYFSWKLGLPFGFHETGRGTLKQAPHTGRWTTNMAPAGSGGPVRAFQHLSPRCHEYNPLRHGDGPGSTDDNRTIIRSPLTRAALRPGAVFADPYGHTLVLVRWVPQESGDRPGVLLAVDAQPDGTVGIKRFWRGNFLFNTTGVIGEPGFKAFRPIVIQAGQPRLLNNREIAADPAYANLSLEQKSMESAVFYDAMERLINPEGLDPEAAMLDLFKALHEQLIVRIESAGNGEAYMAAHPGTVITMPGTPAGVFQAGGLWEDYSTPNRDLRLLIAMDALLDFPARIVRSPGDYKLPAWKRPEKVREELLALSKKRAAELTITYTRSNGAPQTLSIAEILERRAAFEIGYNPNDGIEIRWGRRPEAKSSRAAGGGRRPASGRR